MIRYMDFSVLSAIVLPELILLIFPYAAQCSVLLHEEITALKKNTDTMIINDFFI